MGPSGKGSVVGANVGNRDAGCGCHVGVVVFVSVRCAVRVCRAGGDTNMDAAGETADVGEALVDAVAPTAATVGDATMLGKALVSTVWSHSCKTSSNTGG
jgi:hypothetical protein